MVDFAAGGGDEGTSAFQHRDAVIHPDQAAGGGFAVSLHLPHCTIQQAGGFAGVGRDDRLVRQGAFDFARSQRVEGIGVQHSGGPGGFFAQQGVADRGSAFTQAGPCQQNGVFAVEPAAQRPGVLGVDAAVSRRAAAAGAAFRRTGQHHLHHRLHAGQVDKARPGAESALGAESRRAPVGHTASRRQHTAKAALVGICLPPGQAVLCHFLCDLALHLASSLKKAIMIGTL